MIGRSGKGSRHKGILDHGSEMIFQQKIKDHIHIEKVKMKLSGSVPRTHHKIIVENTVKLNVFKADILLRLPDHIPDRRKKQLTGPADAAETLKTAVPPSGVIGDGRDFPERRLGRIFLRVLRPRVFLKIGSQAT